MSAMGKKDIISKQVFKHLAADIANLLLHLDIEDDSIELLATEQQRIELRQADMVARVKQRNSELTFILHVEIQNDNDPKMSLRMMRYYTDIQLAYPEENIRQYLIYIGKPALKMLEEHKTIDFQYRYNILDMHRVDCSVLLATDTPDALVLAILCDFKERPVQDVVNYIVKRLHELLQNDEHGFRNYFEMLETLSDNRHLQDNIDEAKEMLTKIDVKKFASYRWGVEEGLEEGLEKGLEKGREEGIKEEKTRMAIQLLPMMENQAIATTTGLPLAEVVQLRKNH
jgi:predicted transposase/invertase (TIGR01784 family)